MSQNPLQQYFRQPKIFIDLPSHGLYYNKDTIHGAIENMPVYSMTGMDEMLLKTPDALLIGESVVKVIESCCPTIKDAWDVNMLDLNTLLIAIKIASFGTTYPVSHVCPSCKAENEYDIELPSLIDDYKAKSYNNRLIIKDLVINTRPLNYRQSTNISVSNFQIQQQLKQVPDIADEVERGKELTRIFSELSDLQNEIYAFSIESVKTSTTTVVEQAYIKEWLENIDSETILTLKTHLQSNQSLWSAPQKSVVCVECESTNTIIIEMDQSNFFVRT